MFQRFLSDKERFWRILNEVEEDVKSGEFSPSKQIDVLRYVNTKYINKAHWNQNYTRLRSFIADKPRFRNRISDILQEAYRRDDDDEEDDEKDDDDEEDDYEESTGDEGPQHERAEDYRQVVPMQQITYGNSMGSQMGAMPGNIIVEEQSDSDVESHRQQVDYIQENAEWEEASFGVYDEESSDAESELYQENTMPELEGEHEKLKHEIEKKEQVEENDMKVTRQEEMEEDEEEEMHNNLPQNINEGGNKCSEDFFKVHIFTEQQIDWFILLTYWPELSCPVRECKVKFYSRTENCIVFIIYLTFINFFKPNFRE